MTGVDPTFLPIWAAGIRGQGQIVGCADSGLGEQRNYHQLCLQPVLTECLSNADRFHCLFEDRAVNWGASVKLKYAYRRFNISVFESTSHRKIRCRLKAWAVRTRAALVL